MNLLHYDQELLIEYSTQPEQAQDSPVRLHLDQCFECHGFVESFQEFADLLGDSEVWESPNPNLMLASPSEARIAELRDYASRVAAEEGDAAIALAVILLRPVDSWEDALRCSTRLRSAGGVRKLLDIAHDRVEREPGQALILSSAASELAARLDPLAYPKQVTSELIGRTLKEGATALRYLGRYVEGLEKIDESNAFYGHGSANLDDLAGVWFQKACLLLCAERVPEALPLIQKAASAFQELGDEKRLLQLRVLEGGARYKSGDVRGAVELWSSLIEPMEQQGDLDALGSVLVNIAQGYVQLESFDAANDFFHRALQLDQALGLRSNVARVRWGLARMLVGKGQWDEALNRLRETAAEFTRLEMSSTAALVWLEVADVLLGLDRLTEIEAICRTLFEEFTRAGMAVSAFTAIAYLEEAVGRGTLTRATVRHVHDFLEALPRQPELLFAPPPEP